MIHRVIRAGFLVLGAVLLSIVTSVAQDDLRLDPPTVAPTTCHTSVDPGFIAAIEDRSNDKGFIAAFDDISNDTGFLIPVAEEPGHEGDASASCATVAPLPERDVEP